MNLAGSDTPLAETASAVLAGSARAVHAVVFERRSSEPALARAQEDASPAAVRAITLGTLRWYWRLEALADLLLAQRSVMPLLRSLLLCSLHQLEYSRNPAPALVSSAVDASRRVGQPRAAGMINALLRRYLRERDALMEQALTRQSARSAHPIWLLQALQQAWPQHWGDIIEANNQQAPMTLRVDRSRVSTGAVQSALAALGVSAQTLPWLDTALVLSTPLPVEALPGFERGEVSVQDAGAQLAARLLACASGQQVLDACAAPGGKSAALLEATDGQIALCALDIDPARLQRVEQTLTRLRRQARLVCADLTQELAWWDHTPFDRILLDAPCSASGVIRRHPDIKLLRRSQDIGALALTQRRLLRQCLGLLRPGGRLLYSTCSLLPQENEQVIEHVLLEVAQARVVPLAAADLPPEALPRGPGWQLLPGSAALTDGFYYACLTVT